MLIQSSNLFTAVHPQTKLGKIIQFPLSRIPIVIVFLLPAIIFHNVFLELIWNRLEKPLSSHLLNIETIIVFILLLLCYRLYTKIVEHRPAYEIGAASSLKEIDVGFIIGGGLVLIIIGLLSALGYYRIAGTNHWTILIDAILLFGIGAFLQELVFRIIVFRLVEELLGTWLAVVIIALLFAAAHLGNPDASMSTTAFLVLQDLLLSAAFIYTRRIWLVWGIHAGWNFLQDGVFGMPNSGVTKLPSWITPQITGPNWLTGGGFGIEATFLVTILCLALGIFIILKAIQRGQILQPLWKRHI